MVGQHNIVQDLRPAEEVVWDSYGTPLERLRRIQLWRVADIHKVAYPPGCARDVILRLLENKNLMDGTDLLQPPEGMAAETFWKLINGPSKQYNEYGGASATGGTNVDAMRDALEGKSHFETVDEQPWMPETELPGGVKELEKMSIQELRSAAKKLGLPQTIGMSADDLRALIDGKDAS